MSRNGEPMLPLPDKSIPISVMLIGTFEIGVALLGLILLILVGQFEAGIIPYLTLLFIYGAMGAGLWAIQEWARWTNVVLHLVAIPYIIYTSLFLDGLTGWQVAIQLLIAAGIILALTRPVIRHKFQTVVPKRRKIGK